MEVSPLPMQQQILHGNVYVSRHRGTGGGGSVTVNASDQVTVAHTGHPFSNGDTVTFSGGSSVGGVV